MDKYASFEELENNEQNEIDYSIFIKAQSSSNIAVIAPHGGSIEPGTSEIVLGIAGDELSVALFNGIKQAHNRDLHITSVNFNEPRCLKLVRETMNVLAIHGARGNSRMVFVGGANQQLATHIWKSLEEHEFDVGLHSDPKLQGVSPSNICNQGINKQGVQLELSRGLREALFYYLSNGRLRRPKNELSVFVEAVRTGLRNAKML